MYLKAKCKRHSDTSIYKVHIHISLSISLMFVDQGWGKISQR